MPPVTTMLAAPAPALDILTPPRPGSFCVSACIEHPYPDFVQLAVAQPVLLHGESDRLAIFLQCYPHGMIVALEDLGYLGRNESPSSAAQASVASGQIANGSERMA